MSTEILSPDSVIPSPTQPKSTRELVRERAAAERAAKEEARQLEVPKPKKLTKKEKAVERRKEAGFSGLQGLKKGLGMASWGIKLAKAFAPTVELGQRNRVKVGVRIRPMNEAETRRGDKDKMKEFMELEADTAQVTLTNPRPAPGQTAKAEYFAFDNLYGPNSTSERVFSDLALPLVHLLCAGYNGTIFAYGQTGSGKTVRCSRREARTGRRRSSRRACSGCCSPGCC